MVVYAFKGEVCTPLNNYSITAQWKAKQDWSYSLIYSRQISLYFGFKYIPYPVFKRRRGSDWVGF
jgi:hypothetical protein